MDTTTRGFKGSLDGSDIRDVSEQHEPASQFCIVIQIVDFTDRYVFEVQRFENMGPMVAIQNNLVFIDNDRILKMGEVLKLIGKYVDFFWQDLLMS